MKREGFVVVLSGPSGAGKSTLLKEVLPQVDNLKYSVSATTRPPRRNEVHGKNYFFLSRQEFEERKRAGKFLEWAKVHGHYYATPRDFIERNLKKGQDVILDLDIQGAKTFRKKFERGVFVFVAPPSLEVLIERVRGRGTEKSKEMKTRILNAQKELEHIVDYDYFVLNDKLKRAVDDLKRIIHAERCKVERLNLSELRNGGVIDDHQTHSG